MRLALGNGDGTFAAAVAIGTPLEGPWELVGVRLLGDGNAYLVAIGYVYDDPQFAVLASGGDGSFGAPGTSGYYFGELPWGGAVVFDYNGDGAPDIAFSRMNGSYGVLYGTVSGTHDNLTTFAYDAANRKTGQTQLLGAGTQVTTFLYDSIGLLTSTTDELGRRRDFQYDALNRLTTETWYQTGGTVVYDTRTASYDAVGNQLTATNLAGTVTMSYDALNRVTVQQDTVGQRLTFTYDAVGNATVVQDSKGGVTTSVYDGNNRLTSREFTGNSATLREDLTYTNTGMLATLMRFSDLAATATVATTTYLYDVTDKVTGIFDYKANGTALASFTYAYDSANQLTREVNNGATTSYTYNVNGELKADGTTTYNYDGAGNRANSNYAVTSGNQVTTDGLWTYTYDAVGNLTKKSQGASADTWTYGYDNKNQLLWAEDHATDGGAATKRVDFKYDYYGNRTEKAYDSNGATAGGLTTQMFANVGGEVWADLDSGGSLTTRYLHGDVVDQLFARVDGGTPGWYLTDHLGSVRHVVNNSGVMLATLTYDGWGNATTSGSVGRYQWTGREADVEIELQYNRARYYDPKMGRWISQDPLGFDAGDSNLYRYVNNRPTGATDPSGKEALTHTRAAAEAIQQQLANGPKVETKVLELNGRFVLIPIDKTQIAAAQVDPIWSKKEWYKNILITLGSPDVHTEYSYYKGDDGWYFSGGKDYKGFTAADILQTQLAAIKSFKVRPFEKTTKQKGFNGQDADFLLLDHSLAPRKTNPLFSHELPNTNNAPRNPFDIRNNLNDFGNLFKLPGAPLPHSNNSDNRKGDQQNLELKPGKKAADKDKDRFAAGAYPATIWAQQHDLIVFQNQSHHWFTREIGQKAVTDKFPDLARRDFDIHDYTTWYGSGRIQNEHGWIHRQFLDYSAAYRAILAGSQNSCQFLLSVYALMLTTHAYIIAHFGAQVGPLELHNYHNPSIHTEIKFNRLICDACRPELHPPALPILEVDPARLANLATVAAGGAVIAGTVAAVATTGGAGTLIRALGVGGIFFTPFFDNFGPPQLNQFGHYGGA